MPHWLLFDDHVRLVNVLTETWTHGVGSKVVAGPGMLQSYSESDEDTVEPPEAFYQLSDMITPLTKSQDTMMREAIRPILRNAGINVKVPGFIAT